MFCANTHIVCFINPGAGPPAFQTQAPDCKNLVFPGIVLPHFPFPFLSLSLSLTMLPFQTMQEAELALGRALTCAERLWFRYSAQMPDFLLYCHNTLFMFVVFTLVPLPLALMEIMNPKPLEKYKIQPKVRVPSHSFFKCYKDVLRVFVLAVGPLQFFSYPVVKVNSTKSGKWNSQGF